MIERGGPRPVLFRRPSNAELREGKLKDLRSDFGRFAGVPFRHFFCPILYRDEPAELCLGHVLSRSLTRSDRYRVIQRADVDCFFGATLESVFVPAHDCAPAESSRDLHPMATVGSLLKSAHLMMFFLLGYRYALSPGGWFLGHQVLGSFFRKYANAGGRAAVDAAEAHFRPFRGLVRRIHAPQDEVKGTLGSRELFWCTDGDEPWAFVPVLQPGHSRYAVIIPTLSSPACATRFREMQSAPSRPVEARRMTLYRDEWKSGGEGMVCLEPHSAEGR